MYSRTVRSTSRATTAGDGVDLQRAGAELWRAERKSQSRGAIPAAVGSASRESGRDLCGAQRVDGYRVVGNSESGGRVCAAGSAVSRRAVELHAGGCASAGAVY